MADEPRFLAPVAGYTSYSGAAIDQLEAIGAQEQERQTQAARRAWAEQRRRRWVASAQLITGALDALDGDRFDGRTQRDLRALRRVTDRVSRRLAEPSR